MVDVNDPRTVVYLRDRREDGPAQANLVGEPRPDTLQRLLDDAAADDRHFDVVAVESMETLGTPEQAQAVVGELASLGVRLEVAGSAADVNAVMEKLLAERAETPVDDLLALDAPWRMVSTLLGHKSVETTRSMYEGPLRELLAEHSIEEIAAQFKPEQFADVLWDELDD